MLNIVEQDVLVTITGAKGQDPDQGRQCTPDQIRQLNSQPSRENYDAYDWNIVTLGHAKNLHCWTQTENVPMAVPPSHLKVSNWPP
jgi:hypothetical protein